MKTKTTVLSSLFCAGLLLGTAQLASANTFVTFQVDMTYQVNNSMFTNGVDTVNVLGSFENPTNHFVAPGLILTNNPAVGPNFYEGTVNDIYDTNREIRYKYNINGNFYETTATGIPSIQGNNRIAALPTNSGGSLLLPYQYFSDLGNPIVPDAVFQVDMTQQIALGKFNPNTQMVNVNGSFESFAKGSGYVLTNNPSILVTNEPSGLVTSNVYQGDGPLAGSPGGNNEYKFWIVVGAPTNGYEGLTAANSPDGDPDNSFNRYCFVISNQVFPIVFFSDQPYAPIATNQVTFSVDMTREVLDGTLSNQPVILTGDFNNYDTTGVDTCTNNPNAANTNIYYCTIPITDGYGAISQFKFYVSGFPNGGYENNPTHNYPGFPAVTVGNPNRQFVMPNVTSSNLTLPTVYFDDISANTLLPAPTMVTFTVNMTNAVGTDSSVFNSSIDNVYLNGMDITNSVGFYSFDPWTNSVIVTGASGYTNAIAAFQMVNNPLGSEIYTLTVPVPSGSIPAGYPLALSYQYTFGNNSTLPIEATNSVNHIRYIRSAGGTYVLPQDKFGSMVQEPAFGNLAAGPKSAGKVPITWLGLPHVHLQTKTSLTSGTWTDLLSTDGQNSTNYPVGAGPSYFRLIQPF